MKISRRILSVVLALAMLVTVMPMAVGATEAEKPTYSTTIFEANFDGTEFVFDAEKGKTTSNTTGMNVDPKEIKDQGLSTRDNGVVSATEFDKITGAEHGDVFKYAAGATDNEGAIDDNYLLIPYTSGRAGILENYMTWSEYFEQMSASMDVYLPADSLSSFWVRFYDTTVKTVGDTLMYANKREDKETSTYYMELVFVNDGKQIINASRIALDKWVTFDFCFDFANDTYDVYMDDTKIVDDYKLVELAGDKHLNSFGPRGGASSTDYEMYFDNFMCAVDIDYGEYLEKNHGIPNNTNTVWENNFDNAATTNAFATSAIAGLDMTYTNSNIKITEEADGNKYYTFYPTSGTAHTGNIFNSAGGYFYSNGDTDITDCGIDQYPIDKLKLEFSIKLASLMQTSVNSYYYGTFPATATSNAITNSPMSLITFDANGKIKNAGGKTVIGTYEADEWMDFIIYVDYQAHKAYVVKDNEYLGEGSFTDAFLYFNQIRFRTASSENSGVAASNLAVSIDNIRYSTTYSTDYIKRLATVQNPCTTVLANIDFEDEELNQLITTEYNTNKYYVAHGGNASIKHVATVVDDPSLGSGNKVARLNTDAANPNAYKLGASKTYIQNNDVYTEYDKYPTLVKAEMLMYKNSGAAYLFLGGHELMLWSGSSPYTVSFDTYANNGSSRARKAVGNYDLKQWRRITLYIDFAAKKYNAYIDGEHKGEFLLSSNMTSPEEFSVTINAAGVENVYVDDISISTLPVFNNEIIKYTAIDGTVKYAYGIDNSTDEAVSYAIIKAAFNDADNTLVPGSVSITTEAVAANTLAVKELSVVAAKEGQYNQYFIWNNHDKDITPLVESITIQ